MCRKSKQTKIIKYRNIFFYLLFGVVFCINTPLLSQLSTIHYLPPMYGRDDGILHRHFILVSNPNPNQSANVLIMDGAGNILFEEEVLNQGTFKAFLGEGAAANGVINSDQLNTVISSEDNLIVQSDIPVYVQIRHTVSQETLDNPDRHLHGLITSSKGDWAIGSRFRTGFGYSSNSSLDNNVSPNGRSDFISVMATEDGTTVTFSDLHNRVNLGGVLNTPNVFDVELQAGETYTIAHFPNTDASNLSLNGALVTGSNPIVVNCGSWALDHSPFDNPDRSQREIAAEQIIPMERLDTEYVVMNVDGVELAEKVIIVGDQDNTEYFLHGRNIPSGTLDAGEFVVLDKNQFNVQGNLYIRTSLPAPVYQTTGLQHYSVGYTIVTPLKCWGTQSTIIPRMDTDFVLEDSRINIVAPLGTNLSVIGADVSLSEPILGLPGYRTYRAIPLVTGDIFVSADKNIQVLTSYRSAARGAVTYYAEYFQTDTMLIADRCQGESYVVGSSVYSETGIFYDTLQNINGCDSLVMLDLTMHEPVQESIFGEICSGDSFFFEGRDYSESGVYDAMLSTSYGCDSIITLDLVVHPKVFETINMGICEGEVFAGNTIENDTSIFFNYTSQYDCDSMITVLVEVLEKFETNIDFTICTEEEIEIDGQYFSSEGIFQIDYTAQNGCDSILNVEISYHSIDPVYQNVAVCKGAYYNGIPIEENILLAESTFTSDGCATDLFVSVRVLEDDFVEQSFVLCPGGEFNGIAIYADSTFVEELQNEDGCDSVVVNNIVIQPVFKDTMQVQICEGESVMIFGNLEEEAGQYENLFSSAHDCDSLIVVELLVNPVLEFAYDVSICEGESIYLAGAEQTETGLYMERYQTVQNCDSTVYINLDVLPEAVSEFEVELCADELYNGIMLSQDSLFVAHYTAANSCDSMVYTQVNVHFPYASLDTIYVFEDEGFEKDTLLVESLTTFFGCDSIVSTQVILIPSVSIVLQEVLCEGEFFNGVAINADTTFLEISIAASGADSTVITEVFVNYNSSFEQLEILCEGDIYKGVPIFEDTTFLDVSNNALGCDSLIYTSIEIIPSTEDSILIHLIEGESYEGVFYEQDTTFAEFFISMAGCDSILHTQIVIIPHVFTEDEIYVCENESYLGEFIDRDTVFVELLQSYQGSDSTHTTAVFVLDTITSYFRYTACEGESIFLFGDEWFENETLTELVENSDGCYDLEVYDLFFNKQSSFSFEEEICTGTSFFFNEEEIYQAGIYYDTLTNQYACDSIIILNLSVSEEIAIDVFGAEPYCEGESTSIFAESYASYQWSNGSTVSQIDVFEQGFYEVTVVDQNGCIGFGSIAVPPPNIIAIDVDVFQPDCLAQEFGTADIFTALNDANYNYTLNDASLNDLDELAELEPGFYELVASDEVGCSQSLSFLIENFIPPTASIQSIESIILGDSIQLMPITTAQNIDSIAWTPDQYLSCNNCLSPFASPPNDFTYFLTLITEEGCVMKTDISFKVDKNYSIYIPNAFSPNGDGINDYFTVYAGGAVEGVQSLRVYDRWGEQVFEKEDFPHNVEREGWDGSFRSEKMQVGVFVYYAEILLRTGEVVFEKGDVTIIE